MLDEVKEIRVVIPSADDQIRFPSKDPQAGIFIDGKFLPVREFDISVTPKDEVLTLKIHLYRVRIEVCESEDKDGKNNIGI